MICNFLLNKQKPKDAYYFKSFLLDEIEIHSYTIIICFRFGGHCRDILQGTLCD